MALAQPREEVTNLTPHTVALAADAADGRQPHGPRVGAGQVFGHQGERANQSKTALARARDRRQRRDPAVEENVPEQRLGAVVGGVTEGQNRAPELGDHGVERATAVAAADVAAVRHATRDEGQRARIVAPDPRDAELTQARTERLDRRCELSLLDRDGDELVRKRRPPTVSGQRVHEAPTVLPAGHPHRDPIAGLEHRKASQRLPDPVEDGWEI